MTTLVVNNSFFRGFFEKQKLTGPNFIDWYRQLRIVLSVEDKLDYLEQPMPPAPVPANIQRNLENLGAYEMLQELKTLFAQQAEQELLQTSYIDNLERLGHPVALNLGVSLILISLRKKFDNLVQNYNMHSTRKTVNELHAMLKLHDQTLTKKDHALHVIRAGKALRGSRKLKPGALSLYVGNGQRAAVEAIGSFHLCLPSGLVIVLNNFSRNNMVYFSAIPWDDIFEIDLADSYTNDSSMYAVSKRAKVNLDSALLWHYRLGHISKKRIKKLQHDVLLDSTDLRAFEKCISCMSRKMARKPYTHQVERAKDLLELIHTDVCGPFRTVL
ncbi:zinc finger, CCHC-type containing protein [Tanacetum coccineum]